MPSNQVVLELAIDALVVRPQARTRFDPEADAGLAASVQQHRILQPLLAHREAEEIVVDDGERRLRAAKAAGLTTVPVIVTERALAPAERLQIQLVTACQRQGLSPLDEARAIKRLMDEMQLSVTQVAERLGSSAAKVSRSLKLLSLPESVQAHVQTGGILPSTAYEIACAGDASTQERLAAEALAGKLTRDSVAGRRKAPAPKRDGSTRPKPSRISAPLGGGRSVVVAGPGLSSVEQLIEWLEELLAKARRARPRGIELETFVRWLRDEAKATGGARS